QRAGDEALQTPVAALEPQVCAARGEGARRLLPAHGGGDGRGGRWEEAVVAHGRHADVDGTGRLGRRGTGAQERPRRGDRRGPRMSRGHGRPHVSGTTGALLAGPRVHLDGCGGDRGGGGGRGRGWRTKRDVALHGAAELDQIRVSRFRGEGEHRGRGAVDRNAARDQV